MAARRKSATNRMILLGKLTAPLFLPLLAYQVLLIPQRISSFRRKEHYKFLHDTAGKNSSSDQVRCQQYAFDIMLIMKEKNLLLITHKKQIIYHILTVTSSYLMEI